MHLPFPRPPRTTASGCWAPRGSHTWEREISLKKPEEKEKLFEREKNSWGKRKIIWRWIFLGGIHTFLYVYLLREGIITILTLSSSQTPWWDSLARTPESPADLCCLRPQYHSCLNALMSEWKDPKDPKLIDFKMHTGPHLRNFSVSVSVMHAITGVFPTLLILPTALMKLS